MDELVTYEEVGTVLDYSIPNLTVAIILLGAAIASLAIMLMLPSGSGANGEVKTLWRTSFMVVLLAALPLLAAGSFFGLGGTKVLFPKPSSTSNKILAESVWTVANRSISDKYGDFSFSDNSEIGNSDDSSYRWANPRSYKLEFTVDSG
ncbi:hypothetical protein, partial [Gordonia alkaliphila]|uniref:hypothetical protein n=1 Tax=Gordonia alkaliphila TaxID=1053547 RepID=UPI0031EC364E